MEVFLRHVTLLVIVIGHRATPKKRGAVKNKTLPSFHFPAQRGEAQRGPACCVARAMINSTVYIFLTYSAAQRNAARRGVRWGRTFRRMRWEGDVDQSEFEHACRSDLSI